MTRVQVLWRRMFLALLHPLIVFSVANAAQAADTAERPRLEVQAGHLQAGHLQAVMKVAFDEERGLIIASDLTGAVRSWNIALGRSQLLLAPEPRNSGSKSILVVNTRAGWIATADYRNGRLKVQRIVGGGDITPRGVPPLDRLVLGEDDRRLAALTRDGRLLRFDAATWRMHAAAREACSLAEDDRPGDPYGNVDLVFARNGGELVAANAQGRLAWLDAATGCVKRRLDLGGGRPYSGIVLSRDAQWIALSDYRTITVRRVGGGGSVSLPSSDAMRHLAFSPDAGSLVTASSNGTVRRDDIATGTSRTWSYSEDATALALSRDGAKAAVGLMLGQIMLSDLARGTSIALGGVVEQPTKLARSSDGGLLMRTDKRVLHLDPERGTRRTIVDVKQQEALVDLASDGQWAWLAHRAGGGELISTVSPITHTPIATDVPVFAWASAVAPNGRSIAVSIGNDIKLCDLAGKVSRVLGRVPHPATSLAFSPDGRWLLASGEAGTLQLFDIASSQDLSLASGGGSAPFAFSALSTTLVIGASDGSVREVTLPSLAQRAVRPAGSGTAVTSLSYSPSGALLAIGRSGGATELFNLDKRKSIVLDALSGDAVSLAFLDDDLLAAAATSGEVKLWLGGATLASMFLTKEGAWLAAAPDGRFDSTDLERPGALAWVMPDDPLRPLAPEIFTRDLFEPQLLARLLACRRAERDSPDSCKTMFRAAPALASLNRVAPEIRITAALTDEPNEALVTVETRRGSDPSQPNRKTRTRPYDLHVLRNGQLVARLPSTENFSDNLYAWRAATLVDKQDREAWFSHPFRIRLPAASTRAPVLFSAYAFNEDRVKSATVQATPLTRTLAKQSRRPRAYVVNIGADDYDDPSRNLSFAVADAKAMGTALSALGNYDVITVGLYSAGERSSWRATKPIIAGVLTRLAGRPAQLPADIPNLPRLAAIAPDDILILTFSGHGHAQPDGRFFLLASDSGPRATAADSGGLPMDAIAKFISSNELASWLAPIDAHQITLIIDACHSSATVSQPGFKPGPMGDSGLGQLAYDKGVQILAASQADDVALESNTIKQGLLTFALVREGLATDTDGNRRADEDRNGQLTLTEWLTFAEQRTPALYDDIRDGRIGVALRDTHSRWISRDTGIALEDRNRIARRAQTPSFFNFRRGEEADAIIR